ncbi:CDP-glycerol glycerophosphotransferase family protein [Streptomyces sp. NA02950]|uniref:CDP-glycerol glycerophosphotransferase family protein n=1 Tax=Streptomyces sp. NA02950 TaxID=2742137 RepID=UPI0020CB3C59|nr:CDP-glycerol glycerophosphotransferase family protein [Streptomyces sp. NA02950]
MNRLGIKSPRGLVAFAALAGCLVTAAVAAITGAGGLFAAAGLLGCGCDLLLHRTEPGLMTRLGRLHIGETLRFELRCVLLLLLLGRLHLTGPIGLAAAMTLVLCLLGGQALHAAIRTLIRRRRRLAVVTRNIDLRRLGISDRPPRRLTEWPGQRMLTYELVALLGLTVSLGTEDARWVVAGLALAAGGCLVTVLALVPYLVRAIRMPGPAQVLAEVDAWLIRHRPETVLYFSGSRDSAYQVNMWLETLAALPTPSLVLLRERHLVEELAPTPLPVLCVPSAVHLMNLDLSSVRVALYPANVGKNIHLLRVPTMQHIFLGHGDSDKIASVNPYSKVYDQVWVAGEAGRRRYAEAAVGVRDADIVEVGRPQLDGVRVADGDRAPAPIPTVLYAPTWEGWTDEPGNTSLTSAGEHLVRQLLESERPVRVLYKPHPFTGSRSPAALAAHERVVALIGAANERRAAGPLAQEPEDRTAARAEAARELAELNRRIAALEARLHRADADEAMLTRDSAEPDPAVQAEAEELRQQWHRAHWAAAPPWLHQVVQGPAPTLYQCFDQADLLIGDISSVVSDFIASLKPYALTDTAGLGEAEFRRQFTAARAAYLLDPDASGTDHLLRPLFDPAHDELRTARHELREFLLGPAHPPSVQRFAEAVASAAARGEEVNRLRELQTIREGELDEHQGQRRRPGAQHGEDGHGRVGLLP